MELTPKQQIVELAKGANNILIVTHDRPDGDGLGSALGLKLALTKLNKSVTIAAANPEHQLHHFLPGITEIQSQISAHKDLIISIDTEQTPVKKVMYQKSPDNQLNIIVTPDQNITIDASRLTFSTGQYAWDLIIALDCADIERIGDVYTQNPDMFFDVPVVNIDHHPGNDHWGRVNLVDMTATSTSEILVSVIESLGREQNLLDEDTATCLLCGIISDTNSFQNNNTTPKSFTVAAQLIAAGARQQEIIHNLFRTKSLSTLKLWGTILANVQEEADFVWSYATATEIADAGAAPEQTSGIIDELLKTTTGSSFALMLSERDGGVHGSLRAINKTVDVSVIANLFGGGGHAAAAAFDIPNTTLADSQALVIDKVKQLQADRSGK
ncbi:MAG: DHH family phosphoesterase [Patescibacteria group bacterium]|jgi:phosphoesterase RecJ-like protein